MARGASMQPFVRDGDTLTVEPVTTAAPRPGDIVFLKSATGNILVHRVVRRAADRVITRGDGSLLTDEPVPMSQVIGRVVVIQRGERTIQVSRAWRRVTGLVWMRLWIVRRVLAAVRRRARMWSKKTTQDLVQPFGRDQED
ncbi:MAG: S24/S26 family peptidase [Phycisphaerae bacterium]|nr:S24/S26 family peptidase [Phycisphaerae bacterium]